MVLTVAGCRGSSVFCYPARYKCRLARDHVNKSVFFELLGVGVSELLRSSMENVRREGMGDDEREEEVKMEKFFALIRSFREARNRYRRRELNEMEKKQSIKKTTKRVGTEQASCWVPRFEKEDFATDFEFRGSPLVFPRPCKKAKAEKEKEEEQGSLDLDLSLRLSCSANSESITSEKV